MSDRRRCKLGATVWFKASRIAYKGRMLLHASQGLEKKIKKSKNERQPGLRSCLVRLQGLLQPRQVRVTLVDATNHVIARSSNAVREPQDVVRNYNPQNLRVCFIKGTDLAKV